MDNHKTSETPPDTSKLHWGRVAQLAFLGTGVGLLFLIPERPDFNTLAINFVSIVLEAFPFMLLGSLISGLIEVFVPRERIAKLMPKRRWLTIFLAGGFGLLFPVCECAIVPVVRRLLRKGVPFGAAIAYLLGGPIVNPIVGASTAVAYNGQWRIVALRLGVGYIIAVTVGLIMNALFHKQQPVLPMETDSGCSHDHGVPDGLRRKLLAGCRHAAQDFFDIARYLVIGAFVAAFLQTVISRQGLGSLTEIPILAILLMMLLAVALNLCSEADAFVAASFRSTGLPLSAQLAFMVLGPMLDVKLVLMYLGVFQKRAIVVLATLTTVAVLAAMLILEWFVL